MAVNNFWATIFVCLFLVGCDPTETTEFPEERPVGIISGYVIDGVIADATVTVYGFEKGVRGTRLGGGTTDTNGSYSINIQSQSRPILIEISGGTYIEQASGTSVTLRDGQVLRAVSVYNSGTDSKIMVTPLTHFVSALAEYKVTQGTDVEQAISEAKTIVNGFFNLDVSSIQAVDITSDGSNVSALSDEALYGFYLAGVSSWTYWAGNQNLITPHTTYTSIGLAQLLYNDISSDGLLNGFGYNADRSELIPLAVGVLPLNTDAYRIMFSLHMLAAAANANNNTILKPADLMPVASDIAGKTSNLMGDANPVNIDEQTPELTLDSTVEEIYKGVFDFKVDIGGLLGAKLIQVTLIDNNSSEEIVIGTLEDPKIPVIIIDTTDYIDGLKVIRVEAVDALENEAKLEFPVRFDNTPPIIFTRDKHSIARYSSGDGSYTEDKLQDNNDVTTPLYLETNKLDLNGVQISREQLDNSAMPYFAFSVSDSLNPGAVTDPQFFKVRIQYQRNENIIYPWHEIPASAEEYLIPLVSELLSPQWHQAEASDEHRISVQVIDTAGNPATTSFSFYADFYVPVITLDPVEDIADLADTRFNDTLFENRASLNNIDFSSNTYTLTNTVGKSVYISLADNSAHTVEQLVDQLVRQHLVNKTTTTEWQIGLMNISDTVNCPELSAWTKVSSIMNWTSTGWVTESAPEPVVVEQSTHSDLLPAADDPTPWVDVDHFDTMHFPSNIINQNTGSILSVFYDYILVGDETLLIPQTGYVHNWVYSDPNQNPSSKICDQKRYFQQRQSFAFTSVDGYPKTTSSTIPVPNTPTFTTNGFQVIDNETSLPIDAISGWYRIPAGHTAVITKSVTTPTLIEHNDDVSDIQNFTSYTPNWNDQSITWSVNRNIEITAIHDAGEENISVMPQRVNVAGEGTVDYQIAR